MKPPAISQSEHTLAVDNTARSELYINQSPDLKTLFGKFLLTMFSSWIVTPVGVLLLHFWGWSENPVLISVLLALSAGVPIQLLLNEFVAPGASANNFFASNVQIVTVVIMTVGAIWLALIFSNEVHGGEPFLFAYLTLALLSSGSIWLSYLTSLRYFIAIMRGGVSHQYVILIGATPGLTMLIVFVVAVRMQSSLVLLGAAILPAFAQFMIVRATGQTSIVRIDERSIQQSMLTHSIFLTMSFTLVLIGIGGTILRDYIAGWQQSYAALILAGLNVAGTVVISLSRAVYFSSGKDFLNASGLAAFIFTFASLAIYQLSNFMAIFIAILALQCLIVTILAMGRRRAKLIKSDLEK